MAGVFSKQWMQGIEQDKEPYPSTQVPPVTPFLMVVHYARSVQYHAASTAQGLKPYTKGRAAHIAGSLDAGNYAKRATETLLQRAGKSRLAEEEGGRGSGEEGRKLHFGNGQGVL